MPKREDILRSVLVVSSSGQFDAVVRRSLSGFLLKDFRKSAATARRCLLERDYDIIIVNAPLPDESGEEFAADAAQMSGASVLLVTPAEVYEDVQEHVTDLGILTISKPMPQGRMDIAIRFLCALQMRVRLLEKKVRSAEEKAEEIRIIDRAKIYLVEKKRMTEDEAHRFIGKQAMNSGVSRRRIAERILE